jgi:hypothetical protein
MPSFISVRHGYAGQTGKPKFIYRKEREITFTRLTDFRKDFEENPSFSSFSTTKYLLF